MTTTHTPGPWTFAYGAVYRGEPGPNCENGGIRVALMDRNEPHTSPVERDCNAQLIAAAPELLAALERVMEQIADTGTVNAYEGQRAIAAIAKAKGQT